MSQPKKTSNLHETITHAWELALSGTPIIYLSGPISTGPRLVQELRSGSGPVEATAKARKQNSADLISAADRLRRQRNQVVIEPASLEIRDWTQQDYRRLWQHLIEKHAKTVVFMPGWEFSVGCASEFDYAFRSGLRMETLAGSPLSPEDGIALLEAAESDLRGTNTNKYLLSIADNIRAVLQKMRQGSEASVRFEAARKDKSLEHLAGQGMNVAQFVSFTPERGAPHLAYVRICGWTKTKNTSNRNAIEVLLERSSEKSVNVRSYHLHDSKSREFIYGITSVSDAMAAVDRLSAGGLHTIVNETIDVRDGGVSGVLMGNVIEFSPDDTPRCVEKPGTASLPRAIGRDLLSTVYAVPIEFSVPLASRLEFSVHPRPRGWKQTNVLVWEFAQGQSAVLEAEVKWPNNFSRMLGDKTFGLLVADHFGLPVPHTIVFNRRVAPFYFGRDTAWNERWLRTAPAEQMPGLFTTHRGWIDPFVLMNKEDHKGNKIASVLSQAGVHPEFSGALIVSAQGHLIIEGRRGTGNSLMVGQTQPEDLPENVLADVRELYHRAEAALGAVRFEWVHDGKYAWLVQFHRGATETTELWLTPGEAQKWVEFDVRAGLPALRDLVATLPRDAGVLLNGRIGLTSHLADFLRKTRTPARIRE